jgi:hypothetical protein
VTLFNCQGLKPYGIRAIFRTSRSPLGLKIQGPRLDLLLEDRVKLPQRYLFLSCSRIEAKGNPPSMIGVRRKPHPHVRPIGPALSVLVAGSGQQ